jgi:hypothetical protein
MSVVLVPVAAIVDQMIVAVAVALVAGAAFVLMLMKLVAGGIVYFAMALDCADLELIGATFEVVAAIAAVEVESDSTVVGFAA